MSAAEVGKSLKGIPTVSRSSVQKNDTPIDFRGLCLGERYGVMVDAVPNLADQVETFFDGQTAEIDSRHALNLSVHPSEIHGH